VSTLEQCSLDDVAKELASGTVSRRRALKLIGAALVGGVLALIPGVASADPPAHAPPGRLDSTPNRGGHGAGGRFGQGGPLNDSCGGVCSDDSQCGAGCLCACPHSGAAYFTCC
jgi:hypothetical protein